MRAEVSIRYVSEKGAHAVSSALSPDNIPSPEGLKVETRQAGRAVISTVTCAGGVERLASTLDDLLSCTLVAERAIAALRVRSYGYQRKPRKPLGRPA